MLKGILKNNSGKSFHNMFYQGMNSPSNYVNILSTSQTTRKEKYLECDFQAMLSLEKNEVT